jgi:rod shape-determining protein MreB
MVVFERDMAIDMGSCGTLFYVQNDGIILREPSVVAVDKTSGQMLKCGEDARRMLGRTPANITAIHPLTAGVISDYDMAALMLKDFMGRSTTNSLFKPRVLICVPSSISGVEERAICDACLEAGARKVYLVESMVASAWGAGIDASKPDGHMIIDIGSGLTEIAVVSLNGVAEYTALRIAGDAFDEEIIRYIRKKDNVGIGKQTAEDAKKHIGCITAQKETRMEELRGRDQLTGVPRTSTISSDEIQLLFDPLGRKILEAIRLVLERTPPELAGDLVTNGITLAGGGSLLRGFPEYIEQHTQIKTTLVEDPLECAVYGAGKLLSRLNEMQEGLMNFSRRRLLKS